MKILSNYIDTAHSARTALLLKNILVSSLAKGWSALMALLMVPLTLHCLGVYQNGVWLTVSSILVWVDQMDIGLGNGLRNRLATHVAHDDVLQARKVVSSTMAMLVCIVIPVLLLLLLVVWGTDVYALLNVDRSVLPEFRIALLAGVVLVCVTFVLKFIGNVYMGMQMPAANNLLLALGQTLALVATFLLYTSGRANFLLIVVVNTAAPLLVYLLAYPVTFWKVFPALRPSWRLVNLRSAVELGNLGIKFFWLQIAGIIQFMTANIFISKYFTPEMVTPYQIAYRYMSLVIVGFTIICMPFWNSTTDAYERGDMRWIAQANRKLRLITLAVAGVLVLMVVVSPWVFQVWIGQACHVPSGITVLMALYVYLMVLSMRYSYFLNGIGALRLQLCMTVMVAVFIPLACLVSETTHDIRWLMGVMCACLVPSIVVNMIQFHKVLRGTANGLWRI